MKTADAVIGANFGDEGKGLVTDFLCAKIDGNALVVRSNGGAQAGHTVVAPDGCRHVFSHFGAGSFTGADTFLSRFFVCNPLLFSKEKALLKNISLEPAVYADAAALVTTPYDMMLNQIAEETRGAGRHGSCGVGFGETIERCSRPEYATVVADLKNAPDLKQKLSLIRDRWVPARLKELGIEGLPEKWPDRIFSAGVVDKYLQDAAFFLEEAAVVDRSFLANAKKRVIFEGAQGLLLDQDRGWFPHVTRSHTGLRNMTLLAQEAGIDGIRAHYVTRAYLTRHGAGPLPNELNKLPYARIEDKTNVLNDYQGHLRFAHLDADLLALSIANDLADHKSPLKIEHGLVVTCLDQIGECVFFNEAGTERGASGNNFPEVLQKKIKADFLLTSHGPLRKNINIL